LIQLNEHTMSTSSVAIFSSSAIPSDGAGRLARLEDELAIARAALDGSAEGVVVVDTRNWRVRQINAAALVMLELDGAAPPGIGFDAICRRLRTEDGSTPTPAALLLAPPEVGD
jgi:PAS domain-containing protein